MKEKKRDSNLKENWKGKSEIARKEWMKEEKNLTSKPKMNSRKNILVYKLRINERRKRT